MATDKIKVYIIFFLGKQLLKASALPMSQTAFLAKITYVEC